MNAEKAIQVLNYTLLNFKHLYFNIGESSNPLLRW